MHAYRKSDQSYFPCHPRDVCCEWDGDLNPDFLPERPSLLGDFRSLFEQHWNAGVESLRSRSVGPPEKLAISGYMANLMAGTPAWRRIGVDFHKKELRSYLSFSKKMQERHGGEERLPVKAIEMIERGEITIDIDQDFVRAFITKLMMDFAFHTYHQDWTILQNGTEFPFVTSDNPVAILNSGNGPADRFLPITPSVCVHFTGRRRVKRLQKQPWRTLSSHHHKGKSYTPTSQTRRRKQLTVSLLGVQNN